MFQIFLTDLHLKKWRALDDYENGRLGLLGDTSSGRSRSRHDAIELFEEDRLERAGFAKFLARALAETPERSSTVVALYGDWGSGKTSVLNLCLKALEELHAANLPLTVHFNPWWYSNTGELLNRFFEQLGDALEREESLRGVKNDLLSYKDLIVPAAAFTDLFATGGYVTPFAEILKVAADRATKKNPEVQDIYALKTQIGDRISDSGRRIIVVIDDIDRLSAAEIRDIFKLVKATADFPNTHYLLAFDFETTTAALSEIQGTNGARYLEKIVQAPFRLPDPAPGLLMKFVLEEVEEIASHERRITADEWAQTEEKLRVLAYYGFGALWISMRRVNRFLDAFRLTLSAVAGEARLSDLLVLESLRVVEQRVYDRILEGQDLLLGTTPGADQPFFAGGAQSRNVQEEAEEATRKEVEAICGTASHMELGPVIMELLKQLFPRVQSAIGRSGAYGRYFTNEWINEKRVCVPEFFRVATTWGLPTGTISSSEVEVLLRITDPDLLRERLLTYQSDTRPGVDFSSVLERIGAFYRTEADEHALNTVLMMVLGLEDLGPAHPATYRLAADTLRRLKDFERSAAAKTVILNCVETCGTTPVLAEILRDLGKEHGWRENAPAPEEYRRLSSAEFEEVKSKVAEDIERQSQDGTLLNRDLFDLYLYLWEEIAGKEAPTGYLKKLIGGDRNLVDLLDAYAERSDSAFFYGKGWWQPAEAGGRDMRVRLLEYFGLSATAKVRAKRLLYDSPEWLSEHDYELLEAFVRGYQLQD